MTHTNADPIFENTEFLVGTPAALSSVKPMVPFADETCEFLDTFSKTLRSDPESSAYPDIVSLAFWCRKGNIAKLKETSNDGKMRLGRGRAFHIAPSNVPINFAFSFLFGLLAGCGNIVRVPSKEFPQTAIITRIISAILQNGFPNIAAQNAFVRYSRNDELTRAFSKIADARIIWGGDAAIESIHSFPIKPRGIEVAFADRTSFAVFDEESIRVLSDQELALLAKRFYNDTYLMDQNACSSPHLILWLTKGSPSPAVRTRFWNALVSAAAQYDLPPIKSVDKYTLLCENGIKFSGDTEFESVRRYGNLLYVTELKSLPQNLDELRGTCGLFYEMTASDLTPLKDRINEKFQTVICCGIDRKKIADWVLQEQLTGIDRIVPVGSALDIGIIWDGYDLIKTLSRIIDF